MKSEMQVSSFEADSGPAEADLFIHVLNELTCPLDQKLRAFKMHTKVGARSSILRSDASIKIINKNKNKNKKLKFEKIKSLFNLINY